MGCSCVANICFETQQEVFPSKQKKARGQKEKKCVKTKLNPTHLY